MIIINTKWNCTNNVINNVINITIINRYTITGDIVIGITSITIIGFKISVVTDSRDNSIVINYNNTPMIGETISMIFITTILLITT